MKLYSLLILLLFSIACKKSSTADNNLFSRWKVEGFLQNGSSISENATSNIFLELKNNKTFILEREVNTCKGTFSIYKNEIIFNSSVICTEACCDSAFSNTLLGLLDSVKAYHFTGDQLNFSGPDNLIIRLNPPN